MDRVGCRVYKDAQRWYPKVRIRSPLAEEELVVRAFSHQLEYEGMVNYFHGADDAFLHGMGVEREKLPQREEWLSQLLLDHQVDESARDRVYLAWIYGGEQVGHSSLARLKIGEEAYIHLHLWRSDLRRAGLGAEFFKRSVNFAFEKFRLQRLWCEPCAANPAPNRVLTKLGFRLVGHYRGVPGPINFEQDVNRYELGGPIP